MYKKGTNKFEHIDLNKSYSHVYLQNDKVIITDCYNHAVQDVSELNCPYLILNRFNLSTLLFNELNFDEFGVTHLPNYFFDVNFNMILFTHSFHNKIQIFDLTSDSPIVEIGDGGRVNKEYDSIPFDTHVVPFTNPKESVFKAIQFLNKTKYIEGCAFLNDSTFFVVERNQKIRNLHFYIFKNENWEFYKKYKFINKDFSKKYGLFQFHYVNEFKIFNNKIYFIESYYPENSKNYKQVQKYLLNIDDDELKFSVYEYEIQF